MRLQVAECLGAYPQEARTARAAQELAAGGGEHVAAELGDVHGKLADGLGGVEEEGNAGGAGDASDLGGRVDQAAAGGDVSDAHQPGAVVDQVRQGGGVELPVLVVGDDDDLGPGALGRLQVGEDAAAVLGPAGEDAIARLERHGVERGVPGVGGVVEQRDLVRPAAHQSGDVPVGGIDAAPFPVRGLVAADRSLQLQMGGHGPQRLPRQQARACVVEVDPVRSARRVLAECFDVHALHGPKGHLFSKVNVSGGDRSPKLMDGVGTCTTCVAWRSCAS